MRYITNEKVPADDKNKPESGRVMRKMETDLKV